MTQKHNRADLFVYCQPDDLSNKQLDLLKSKYQNVTLLHTADFSPLLATSRERERERESCRA